MGTHPETLVMVNDIDRLGPRRQEFSRDFVVGLVLEQHSKAYYFSDVQDAGVINDAFDEIPVVVWASGNEYAAYIRQVGDRVLTFYRDGADIFDRESGTRWDFQRGLGVEGPLTGEALQPVPSLSAFDWAWESFYPQAETYQP